MFNLPLVFGIRIISASRPIKHLSNLLKRMSLSLRKEEPGNNQHHDIKAAEKDIIMPTNPIQRNGVHKSQHNKRGIHTQQLNRQSFTANRVWENLGWITEQ